MLHCRAAPNAAPYAVMKSHIFQAILIVGTVVVMAAVLHGVMRTPQYKPQQSALSRPAEEDRDLKALCGDIWSGKRTPYLSFEMWCADIKPITQGTAQR